MSPTERGWGYKESHHHEKLPQGQATLWPHTARAPSPWRGRSPAAIVSVMEKRKKTVERPPPEPTAETPAQRPGGLTEIGGRKGPEPTRYGDWEVNGRCVDF